MEIIAKKVSKVQAELIYEVINEKMHNFAMKYNDTGGEYDYMVAVYDTPQHNAAYWTGVADAILVMQDTRKDNVSLTPEEREAGMNLGKFRAIRLYSDRTGISLGDSMLDVEAYFNKHNLRFN